MSRKKRDREDDDEPVEVPTTHRAAVLCPEPTLILIREFAKMWRRSLRVTADDLIEIGRQQIDEWWMFEKLQSIEKLDRAPALKIAWVSPKKKRYVDLWAKNPERTIPYYQAFDELIHLGAWTWHIRRLPRKASSSYYYPKIVNDPSPNAEWRKRLLKRRAKRNIEK